MAARFREIWEREHPEYRMLQDTDPDKELLEWAFKEKYIRLQEPVPGVFYYSDFELEVAKMWKEKTKNDKS